METSLADGVAAERLLAFDRESGKLTGAGVIDRVAVLSLQAGSVLTRPYLHHGHRLGCKAVATAVADRDIIVRLNEDAAFAIPFCDGYWSRMLNRRYDYEAEIEAFLRTAEDLRYSFVDCGANFGYWSVLASSRPFGRQPTLAVEASLENAKRLQTNALLNGERFRWLNAAIGNGAGGFVRITGARHEALGTLALTHNEPDAVPTVSLDSLVADGLIEASLPVVIKLERQRRGKEGRWSWRARHRRREQRRDATAARRSRRCDGHRALYRYGAARPQGQLPRNGRLVEAIGRPRKIEWSR
jgi:FkbM family methyltransferase